MKTKTFNISLPDTLVKKIDRLAKKRDASRSELIREALRRYADKQKEWELLFEQGERLGTRAPRLTYDDVATIISKERKAGLRRA